MKEITIYAILLSFFQGPFLYAELPPDISDFFDDIELQDIQITSGGTLTILSGATLGMASGSVASSKSGAAITRASIVIGRANDDIVKSIAIGIPRP